MIKGTKTALITPFLDDGSLDEKGLEKLIGMQNEGKVDGIVLLGTTGEAPTLTTEERERAIRIAKANIAPSLSLWIGTGSNCTQKTIEETKRAQQLGADGALIVTPYYNKPTQEGLYAHYAAIARATELPIILYNVPGRCSVTLSVSTIVKLAKIPTICGIKEASGNLLQMMDLIEAITPNRSDFAILSGDDALTLPLMAVGGHGIVSVVSNLVPEDVSELVQACFKGNFEEAKKIHYRLLPLFRAAFIETNPIPIKTLMRFAHLPSGPCRLPLSTLEPENERKLRHLYETLKLPLLAHG